MIKGRALYAHVLMQHAVDDLDHVLCWSLEAACNVKDLMYLELEEEETWRAGKRDELSSNSVGLCFERR